MIILCVFLAMLIRNKHLDVLIIPLSKLHTFIKYRKLKKIFHSDSTILCCMLKKNRTCCVLSVDPYFLNVWSGFSLDLILQWVRMRKYFTTRETVRQLRTELQTSSDKPCLRKLWWPQWQMKYGVNYQSFINEPILSSFEFWAQAHINLHNPESHRTA